MWAVRRVSTQLRNQGLASRISRISYGKPEIARCSETCIAGIVEPQEKVFDVLQCCTWFYTSSSNFLKSHREVRTFSSQADTKSNGEDADDLADGFSDLETPQDTVQGDDSLSFELELSDLEGNTDEVLSQFYLTDADNVIVEEKSRRKSYSEMTKAILDAHDLNVRQVMDKWVDDEKEITKTEVLSTVLILRKRRRFFKALELSKWLKKKRVKFIDTDYATRVDLIARVEGFHNAEHYFKQIPESFRTEIVYPITIFSFHQLLLLYQKSGRRRSEDFFLIHGRRRSDDFLLMMEKENVKPSMSIYRILIDFKGQSKDIHGMEHIVEIMKDLECM